MSDYPDPDEEFELMYGDDLDILRTQNEGNSTNKIQEASQNLQNENDCSRKRSINELFGNIEDIDDDHEDQIKEIQLPKPKKIKTMKDDNVEKLALIEHILELRKQALENVNSKGLKKKVCTAFTENIMDNVSCRVPKYPFTVLTSTEGDRLYVRTHSEAYWDQEIKNVSKVLSYGSDLDMAGPLGTDFDEIWREAQEHFSESINISEVFPVPSYNATGSLWVESYKPRKYIDLLSDEATNRTLLRWIMLWDRVVFNRRAKISTNLTQYQKNIFEIDPDHRPKYKIVLLAGPPGLGKTTLAHLVALHAGYKPLEVNASDDRSPDAFKRILDNATTMTSVLDTEKRPNCVIFDEIDGAPSNAIDYLCRYIQGSIKQKSKTKPATNKSTDDGKSEKKKILKRPIIAICNDAYVPSLRILRQMALVLHVPAISSNRLTQRLIQISETEGIKISRHVLSTLAEKSNCDIRNCLSLLQFYKVQNEINLGPNSVTLEKILNIHHSKDVNKGLFQVWSDIFFLPRNKDHTVPTEEERSQNIQRATSSFDFDKLSAGVFENYVRLSSVRDNMKNAKKALDWFSSLDVLNKRILQTQNYQMAGYLTWGFVQWHLLFGNVPNNFNQRVFLKNNPTANNTKTFGTGTTGNVANANNDSNKIIFPSASGEVRMQAQKTDAIFSDLLKHMTPQIRSYVTKTVLVIDIVPLLGYIINPSLRPVNLHLYTQKEKDELSRVVRTMIDYGLNYIQERTVEGTYAFNLDPNIEELSKFTTSNRNVSALRSLSYPNRQLVAREIELEKMRLLELAKNRNASEGIRLSQGNANTQVPNYLAKLTPKKINLKTKETKKFFTFLVKDNESNKEKIPEKGGFGNVYFQFKEGHTNAVKKTIKISSLLHD